MKITGGKYKGKNVMVREERTLRPTAAKIRETIFNILMHGKFLYSDEFIADDNADRIAGRRVLDLFCGTGSLGLEAISRGATSLVLIDQNAGTLSLARENVEDLGEIANATFIRSDSTNLPPASKPCDLVFIDPPYNRNLVAPALKSLRRSGWLEYGAIIVIEQGTKDELEISDEFQHLDTRTHDKTVVTVLQFIEK